MAIPFFFPKYLIGYNEKKLPIKVSQEKISITHGLILITGNRRHFDRIPGLAIENWLQESTI